MDVFEAIDKRHSYRGGFLDEQVPRDDLTKIVQAGIQAPSGVNGQTTSFIIVDDPAVISNISEIIDRPVVHEAKAIIVCCIEERDVYHGMSFAVEDCAAAVENMLLAVTALGYATVWIDGALRQENIAEEITKLLSVEENKKVRIILPLGRPKDQVNQKEKLTFEERAKFI